MNSFEKGIPEAMEKIRACISEENEDTLLSDFMAMCEKSVLKNLVLTPEEEEKIISEKASRIYSIQSRGNNISLEKCRYIPVNAGSLHDIVSSQLIGEEKDQKTYMTLVEYQQELYKDLLGELFFDGTGIQSADD